jgi:hypothetical protein
MLLKNTTFNREFPQVYICRIVCIISNNVTLICNSWWYIGSNNSKLLKFVTVTFSVKFLFLLRDKVMCQSLRLTASLKKFVVKKQNKCDYLKKETYQCYNKT